MALATKKQVGDNSNIDIFLRIRPVSKPSPNLLFDPIENRVDFGVPRNLSSGYINNQREHYEFRFNGVLTPDAKQDEVFERVARGVAIGALEGFNGTVFAYGQTGSGKTFTVTGGPERYVDRGIIPRSISLIFSEVAKRSDYTYTVHISYLEIYNEVGYDLLDPNREVQMLEDLPRVHIMEDDESNIHMRNLSVHRANNEEEALNLLFLGDTNRTISETPMNMASSRSHCVFTIYVEARKAGEEVVRRSKLNLVDLAGSERVSKTNIDGTILREAKYINLSLHYLEQVIIALQERSMGQNRPHVPYRNSMMTTVLRDSLGGNCRTVMIANITSQQEQLDESISTCRFAQRVAMVSNLVVANEEVDPSLVIKRLKQEIRELKDEIRMLQGGEEEQLHKLKVQVQQRDNEINILVSMLKKREDGKSANPLAGSRPAVANAPASSGQPALGPAGGAAGQAGPSSSAAARSGGEASTSAPAAGRVSGEAADLLDVAVLADRSKAFELFRKSYRKNEVIEENKQLLKAKYTEAKQLGAQVNESRQRINELKALIEQRRIQRSMAGLGGSGADGQSGELDPEEERAKALIEKEKASYKDDFAQLRRLKQEIENLQQLLEQSRTKLQRDFEQWLGLMLRQQAAGSAVTAGSLTSQAGSPRASMQPQRPYRSMSEVQPLQEDVPPPATGLRAVTEQFNRAALTARRQNSQPVMASHTQATPISTDPEDVFLRRPSTQFLSAT
ncbi:hypothetical protein WJX72_010914 [[Myrmecia] bisecta]|uniref:Kinesin-like protein n=1 Tax=[Myrmecia] bisecta TaxID=41462 RepID=A0AAW1PT88_9CHLO